MNDYVAEAERVVAWSFQGNVLHHTLLVEQIAMALEAAEKRTLLDLAVFFDRSAMSMAARMARARAESLERDGV